jgi:hypothetical protein
MRSTTACALIAAGCLAAACSRPASTPMPNGSSSDVRTADGISVALRVDRDSAMTLLSRALDSAGYAIDARSAGRYAVTTAPRLVAGDTTIVVTAQAFASDPAGAASIVTFSATYSIRGGLRDARVVEGRSPATLWNALRALAHAVR